MAGVLQLAQIARTARARVRTARELQGRWKALPPEEQAAARDEWDALAETLDAVSERLTAGPRGFAREFGAAYRGEEAAPAPEPRPLIGLVRELTVRTAALRAKLDAAEARAD
jgi:hypothetical protein